MYNFNKFANLFVNKMMASYDGDDSDHYDRLVLFDKLHEAYSEHLLENYPILKSRTARPNFKNNGPPGLSPQEMIRILTPEERKKWQNWAVAITCGENGVYLHDVEDFLTGRPNTD